MSDTLGFYLVVSSEGALHCVPGPCKAWEVWLPGVFQQGGVGQTCVTESTDRDRGRTRGLWSLHREGKLLG